MKNEKTIIEVEEAINEVRTRHFAIINYILNKSYGADYEKLMEELEEFEDYLADSIHF